MNTVIDQSFEPENCLTHRYGFSESSWSCLSGRRILVTGGATGFGYAISDALCAAGAHVFIASRRKQLLEAACRRLKQKSYSGFADSCSVDLTEPESIRALAQQFVDQAMALDGLVHCAALPSTPGLANPLLESSCQQWDALMHTNVRGPWFLTRELLPSLARASLPRVIFLTSEAGWADTPEVASYNISKAALNSLSMSLSEEFKKNKQLNHIHVNAVIPGEALTEMNKGSLNSPFTVVGIILALLLQGGDGPSGYFFHRDGRHFGFAYRKPWGRSLRETIQGKP